MSAGPFAGLPFTVPAKYQGYILLASQQSGIPANVLAAQIQQESGFDPTAVSSTGAEGIAQFEPDTAASNGVNPHDTWSSISGMAKLDAEYQKEFGSLDLALAAYNAGPGAVQNAGNAVPQNNQTPDYVANILKMAGISPGSGGSGTGSGSGSDAFGATESVLANINSPEFWKRVGKGAAAAGIIGVGIWFLVEKQPGSLKPARELVNIK